MSRKESALVLLLGGLALIFAALAGYFYIQTKQNNTSAPTSQAPAPVDEMANWKTYEDSDFKLAFKYPNSWSEPKVSIQQKNEEPWWLVEGKYLNFNNTTLDTGIINFDLTKYKSYKDKSFNDRIDRIKEIFNTKKVTNADVLWIPPQNAAIGAASKVEYIENSDGSYRGIYYFANIAQDDVDYNLDYSRLFNLVVILTDSKENILQIFISSPFSYNETKGYIPFNFCQKSGKSKCVVNENLYNSFSEIYKKIALSVHSL